MILLNLIENWLSFCKKYWVFPYKSLSFYKPLDFLQDSLFQLIFFALQLFGTLSFAEKLEEKTGDNLSF